MMPDNPGGNDSGVHAYLNFHRLAVLNMNVLTVSNNIHRELKRAARVVHRRQLWGEVALGILEPCARQVSLSNSLNFHAAIALTDFIKLLEELVKKVDELWWFIHFENRIKVNNVTENNSHLALVLCNVPGSLLDALLHELRKHSSEAVLTLVDLLFDCRHQFKLFPLRSIEPVSNKPRNDSYRYQKLEV